MSHLSPSLARLFDKASCHGSLLSSVRFWDGRHGTMNHVIHSPTPAPRMLLSLLLLLFHRPICWHPQASKQAVTLRLPINNCFRCRASPCIIGNLYHSRSHHYLVHTPVALRPSPFVSNINLSRTMIIRLSMYHHTRLDILMMQQV
jgi:hypothetical protein